MTIFKNSNGTSFVFASLKSRTFCPEERILAQKHIERYGVIVCDLVGKVITDENELLLIEKEFIGTDPADVQNDATDLATRFFTECIPDWNKGVSAEEETEIIALFATRISKDASLQKTLLENLESRGIRLLLSPLGIQYSYDT